MTRFTVGLSALALVATLGACGQPSGPPGPTEAAATPAAGTEAAPEAAAVRDTIIVGSWQEPRGFLDYANGQAIRVEVEQLDHPRWVQTRSFEFQPNPALIDGDLPSLETGGAELKDVSYKAGDAVYSTTEFQVVPAEADGTAKQLVVTGKIKPGLKWSDGEPLTAGDFVFAYNTACDPDSSSEDQTYCKLGSSPGAGGLLASYEAPDDTTLVATYVPGALDPLYFATVFGPQGGPLPEHVFGGMSAADIAKDERATGGTSAVPLAYGPYMMKSWEKGDKITFEPNPHWSGTPPKTPKIVYKFFADSVALASAVIAGDIDSASGTTGVSIDQYPYLVSVQENGDITLEVDKDAASFEHITINLYDPKDSTFKTPHPVLSDINVRKAIAMALDRQQMVDTIFFGQSSLVDQPHLPQMASYNEAMGKITFDVEGAKKLLDDAGWVPGEDGIRVKDGQRAAFTLLTTSGNPLRQKSTQILQSNLKDVGIEVSMNYQPSSVVFSDDGINHRLFEVAEYANVFSSVDPGSWWYGMGSCLIAAPENNFASPNVTGWCDEEASDAVTRAAYLTLDPAERKAAWDVALTKYFENGMMRIPLFIRPSVLAKVPELAGPALDSTEYFTWNAADWTLAEPGAE
jgi:peptide/nickel transport system substrate-binding protein